MTVIIKHATAKSSRHFWPVETTVSICHHQSTRTHLGRLIGRCRSDFHNCQAETSQRPAKQSENFTSAEPTAMITAACRSGTSGGIRRKRGPGLPDSSASAAEPSWPLPSASRKNSPGGEPSPPPAADRRTGGLIVWRAGEATRHSTRFSSLDETFGGQGRWLESHAEAPGFLG